MIDITEDKVVCAECQAEGLKSQVFPGYMTCTAMYCPPFYDEDGKLHTHDSNTCAQVFACSNNHEWVTKQTKSCWCGWKA